MLQVEVANVIITQCFSTFEILENINVKSSSRSFDAFDLPYAIDPKFVKVLGSVCLDLSPTSDVAEAHQRQLKRNLASTSTSTSILILVNTFHIKTRIIKITMIRKIKRIKLQV